MPNFSTFPPAPFHFSTFPLFHFSRLANILVERRLANSMRQQYSLPDRNHSFNHAKCFIVQQAVLFRIDNVIFDHLVTQGEHVVEVTASFSPTCREAKPSETKKRTLREERTGRLRAERREPDGRGSAHAPRRPRGARSRHRGDKAPHGDSRMRAARADARRTGARPKTPRKREGATRRTPPESPDAADFGVGPSGPASGALPCEASWAGLRSAADLAVAARPHDAQVARMGA